MRTPAVTPNVHRVAFRIDEAAASLGVSRDYLERHILAELRVIRRGALKLIPLAELERWARENAAFTLEK